MPFQTRQTRSNIYALKRLYGLPCDVYHRPSMAVDYSTGRQVDVLEKWSVNRAILLPTKDARSSESYSSSHSATTYNSSPSVTEVGVREVVIDLKDLPSGKTVGVENYYLVIGQRRFEVVSVTEYDVSSAVKCVVKELKGAELDRILELAGSDSVAMGERGLP